jgi:DNA-directed RNA polymerase subunit L
MKKTIILFFFCAGVLCSGCGSKTQSTDTSAILPQTPSIPTTAPVEQLPHASSSGSIIDRGYTATYEPDATPSKTNNLLFISPNGKQLKLPTTVATFLNDSSSNRHLTSLDIPVDEKNPNSLYLTTNQPLDTNFNTLENHIYRYDILKQELESIYEEKTTNSTMLRTIGRDGTLVLLIRENINTVPKPCDSVWYNFAHTMLAFDTAHPNIGLQYYTVPIKKQQESYHLIENCLKGT